MAQFMNETCLHLVGEGAKMLQSQGPKTAMPLPPSPQPPSVAARPVARPANAKARVTLRHICDQGLLNGTESMDFGT